jgi:hypothetical protein
MEKKSFITFGILFENLFTVNIIHCEKKSVHFAEKF